MAGPNIKFNLVMMMFAWIAASFTFNLLAFFVKYMPGDVYTNSTISGLACVALLFEPMI